MKMRHAPPNAVQRRRVGRLLRSVDVYVVFAILGVVGYIIVVNLAAETVSMNIQDGIETQRATAAADGAAAELPAEVYWPYKWPTEPLAEVKIVRDATRFVEASLMRLAPLVARLPAAQLALWDLLLLTGVKTEATVTAVELRRIVTAALSPSPSPPSRETTAAVREAVESAAAVWAVKGMSAEVAEAQNIVSELLPSPSPSLVSLSLASSSWESLTSAIWGAATHAEPTATINLQQAYQHVLNVSKQFWAPARRGVPLSLAHQHLLPLQGGSYDAVVPLTRLLLHLWILGDRRAASLVAAYDAAVGTILRDLVHTRTVADGPYTMNYTFVAASAEYVVPMAAPRTCALAGLLAQGVRHGAHRYPDRSATLKYTEDDVLKAAEALATSCFQQYTDPAGHRLRRAVYVTSHGPVAGLVSMGEGKDDGRGTPTSRTTSCDVPFLLLESFYELYLTTQDAMYGLWSLLVMSDGTSDHCAVTARDITSAGPWVRYARELRSLVLLVQRMDCLIYRRSRGTRGLCEVTATTMVSPFTGHLVRLPARNVR
ncbi:hypothetical protein ABB37_07039 [Leptomonas pyrrhocoris]|uniref:Uncharacterized protein n=1 Tax=Leptomonas pyrrhocoris TaxID=157538 RepID=A0A0N0DTM8_LEPPY|nr:hypothetical protein ABB37_07039 [Leptomonas pyrrhocoris]KPA77718.1 hypothetical protein ABB37_07039 [Leptomonas pyrrhocoris]|eukprot:XP_015656157.1 hypothetical protein ABB37_07039 [Leptomonas pyrrhocoris]